MLLTTYRAKINLKLNSEIYKNLFNLKFQFTVGIYCRYQFFLIDRIFWLVLPFDLVIMDYK